MISSITRNFKKGPYILSDKRWKDSNVFYRYGGFILIVNEHGEYYIRDQEGNLIKDHRTPFYQVPDFVKDFDDYLNTINKSGDLEVKGESKLEQYQIETALSYSNAGGVYLATRKKDNLKVIIKEARPNAGLDGVAKDALARQKIEYDALKKLKNVPGVVNLIEYFQEWEHYFLVEEFIEGRDLRQWIAQDFPFYRGSDSISDHAKNVKKYYYNFLSYYRSELSKIAEAGYNAIPDFILSIDYSNGSLRDVGQSKSYGTGDTGWLEALKRQSGVNY
nr:DUF4885 family protein [Bacillus subtilis]